MRKITMTSLSGVCGVFLLASPAHAYLDPGSGSMLLQLLLGGVAGAVVVLKLYWQRLLHFLGLRKGETSVSPSLSSQPDSKTEFSPEQRQ